MASALRRPVGEVEDARAKGLRVHKLQRLLIAPFLKEALPAAQDNGMDHEPKLVEEVVLSNDRTRAPLPRIVMSLPGCCLSSLISSATSPLIRVEFCHSRGSSRVVETTNLGTLFK